MLWGRKY
jgi:hypothetical protein